MRALLIVLTVLAVIPAAAFGLKWQYVLIKANKDLNDSAVMVPVPCDGGEIDKACTFDELTVTAVDGNREVWMFYSVPFLCKVTLESNDLIINDPAGSRKYLPRTDYTDIQFWGGKGLLTRFISNPPGGCRNYILVGIKNLTKNRTMLLKIYSGFPNKTYVKDLVFDSRVNAMILPSGYGRRDMADWPYFRPPGGLRGCSERHSVYINYDAIVCDYNYGDNYTDPVFSNTWAVVKYNDTKSDSVYRHDIPLYWFDKGWRSGWNVSRYPKVRGFGVTTVLGAVLPGDTYADINYHNGLVLGGKRGIEIPWPAYIFFIAHEHGTWLSAGSTSTQLQWEVTPAYYVESGPITTGPPKTYTDIRDLPGGTDCLTRPYFQDCYILKGKSVTTGTSTSTYTPYRLSFWIDYYRNESGDYANYVPLMDNYYISNDGEWVPNDEYDYTYDRFSTGYFTAYNGARIWEGVWYPETEKGVMVMLLKDVPAGRHAFKWLAGIDRYSYPKVYAWVDNLLIFKQPEKDAVNTTLIGTGEGGTDGKTPVANNLYWTGYRYATNWVISDCGVCRLESVKPNGYCFSNGTMAKCTELYSGFPACVNPGDRAYQSLTEWWECEYNSTLDMWLWKYKQWNPGEGGAGRFFNISLPYDEIYVREGEKLTIPVTVMSNMSFDYTLYISSPFLRAGNQSFPMEVIGWEYNYTDEYGRDMTLNHYLDIPAYGTRNLTLTMIVPPYPIDKRKYGAYYNLTVYASGSARAYDSMILNLTKVFFWVPVSVKAYAISANGTVMKNLPVSVYICEPDVAFCNENADWLYRNTTTTDDTGYFEVSTRIWAAKGDRYKIGVVTEKGYAETVIRV